MVTAEDTPETGVQVTMFGEMQFFRGGGEDGIPTPIPVRLKTKKTGLLFAYLLLHPDRTFSREVLAAQFWPESDGEASRRSLRDALLFIRAALSEAEIPDDALAADRNTIRLAPGVFRTDAAAFDEALNRAARRPAPPTEAQIAALEEAVALYHGEFLPGFYDVSKDEEWIEPTRRRCAAAFDDALLRLSTLCVAQNDWRHSLTYARRAADNAPDDESRAERVRELTDRIRHEERLPVPKPPAAASVTESVSTETPTERTKAREVAVPSQTREASVPSSRPQWGFAIGAVSLALAAGIGGGAFLRSPAAPNPIATATHAPIPNFEYADPANPNYFTAPVAQGLTNADYLRTLRAYQKSLAETDERDQRQRWALKIMELGASAHFRDKGEGVVALAAFDSAVRVFREDNDDAPLVRALLLMATAATVAGQRDHAVQALREAEQVLRRLTPELVTFRVSSLLNIADVCLDLGAFEEVRRSLEQCRELERKRGANADRRYAALYKRFRGKWASDTGDYPAAKRLLNEAEREMLLLKDLQTRADILGNLGDLYYREGNLRAAKLCYKEGLEVWEKSNHSHYTGLFKARQARLALAEGREAQMRGDANAAEAKYAECERQVDESLKVLEQAGGDIVRALPLCVQGRLTLYSAGSGNAQVALNRSLALRRRLGNPMLTAEALEALAEFHWRTSQKGKAAELLQGADALRRKAGTPLPPCDLPLIAPIRRDLGLPPPFTVK